ncbi:hypothetical protein [uncultured Mediterranean phage uvMED]|nr:hypothetical protein [uncultured Mediterranean phage uvMED]
MAGKPLHKIQCESFTRGSKFTKQCLCKGYFQKTSGKYRCKYHGGASTGPRSLDGKIKALKNLKHFKNKTEEELIEWIKQKRYAKD